MVSSVAVSVGISAGRPSPKTESPETIRVLFELSTWNMTQDNNKHIIGRCPVCGNGSITEASGAFFCDGGKLPGGGRCGFRIFRKIHGIELDASLVTQLITEGKTHEMPMVNHNGQTFMARFVIVGGRVDVHVRSHALRGRCPVCGGRVLRTSKGYACEYSLGRKAPCQFHVTGMIHGRTISESEMERFLDGELQVLDGFTSVDGKVFSSVMVFKDGGLVGLDSKITTCPSCGGNILVSPLAYNCSNFKNPDFHCRFSLWRNIAGHHVSGEEMRQICEEGRTREPLELFQTNGAVYYQRLGLSPDKKRVIKI